LAFAPPLPAPPAFLPAGAADRVDEVERHMAFTRFEQFVGAMTADSRNLWAVKRGRIRLRLCLYICLSARLIWKMRVSK